MPWYKLRSGRVMHFNGRMPDLEEVDEPKSRRSHKKHDDVEHDVERHDVAEDKGDE